MLVRLGLVSLLAVALAACGSGQAADIAVGTPSPTPSADVCTPEEGVAYDVRTTEGSASADAAATAWAEAYEERDSRYMRNGDWRVVSQTESGEQVLRSGKVQVGVGQGEDGTWHMLGASLCRNAER